MIDYSQARTIMRDSTFIEVKIEEEIDQRKTSLENSNKYEELIIVKDNEINSLKEENNQLKELINKLQIQLTELKSEQTANVIEQLEILN
jgi:hypothetical protein